MLNWFAVSRGQVGFWTAWWAGYGLRVEPPVQWVIVFFEAVAAERELSHRRVLSVVRQPFDYGESWSAVGACDEEILVPRVFRVAELCEALVAYGYVWRCDGARKLGFFRALNYDEFVVLIP